MHSLCMLTFFVFNVRYNATKYRFNRLYYITINRELFFKEKIRLLRNEANHTLVIEWYDEYSKAIFKYILKLIKDAEEAEDLTQETFIKAYTYLSEHKRIDYPKTFLYRIAYHLTIDHTRKHKPIRVAKDFFSYQKDPGPSVEHIVEVRESSYILYEALDVLKPAYKKVIILREIEAFSVRETSEVLGWSESKVKSTLFRAKKVLKKHLIKEGVIDDN